jgi:hypothetical protein
MRVKSFLYTLFFSVFCLGFSGCEEKNPSLILNDFVTFDGCSWNIFYPDIAIPQHYVIIINSQEELTSVLYCESRDVPSYIDFKKNTILLFYSTYYRAIIAQKLQKEDNLTYKWDIDLGQEVDAPAIFAVLAPKFPKKAQVETNVNFN